MFWYEEDIKRLERKLNPDIHLHKPCFYGSSTFTLWDDLEEDFREFSAVNLGFGGATLASCAWFFERVVVPYKPSNLVIYAGDNDLGDGRHPEEIFIFYRELFRRARYHLGNVPVIFVSVKPSPARWNLKTSIEYLNRMVKNDFATATDKRFFLDIYSSLLNNGIPNPAYYQPDGLHLSKSGYSIIKEIILDFADDIFGA